MNKASSVEQPSRLEPEPGVAAGRPARPAVAELVQIDAPTSRYSALFLVTLSSRV